MSNNLNTAREWNMILETHLLDWDGFKDLPETMLLTKDEFEERVMRCTRRFISSPTSPSGIEAKVCEDIRRRQEHGLNKYGTTVADNPLTLKQWLQHSYEEKLDDLIYMKKAIEDLDKIINVKPQRDPNILRHYFDGGIYHSNQCVTCGHFPDHDIHA